VKQLTDLIEQKIASDEVKSAEFKALCDELCQMLVDSGTQAHFDMAESNKEMLVRILQVWTEGSRKDEPPINPWNLCVMNVVPAEVVLKIAKLYQKKDQIAPLHPNKSNSKKLFLDNAARLNVVFMSFELLDHHPLLGLTHTFLKDICKRPDLHVLVIDTTPPELAKKSRAPDGLFSLLIEALGSRYVNCFDSARWDTANIVQRIRQHKAGIVVTLGHFQFGSERQRSVVEEKPAPVIVQFLSHMGTTGNDAVDHIVACPKSLTADMAGHFSETPLLFPEGYSFIPGCGIKALHPDFRPPEDADAVQRVRDREGLPQGVLIGCFSDFDRMDSKYIASLCRVLKGITSGKAVVISRGKFADMRVKYQAGTHDCSERFHFAEFIDCDKPRFWSLMGALDLFYDPFNYNGHTLGVEIAWSAGILLTLKGKTLASRVGASLLNSLGVEHCIHETEQSMEDHAIRLGNSEHDRQELRARMLQVRDTSPLFRGEFATLFAAALRASWKRYRKRLIAPLQEVEKAPVQVSNEDLQQSIEHMYLMHYAKDIISKTEDVQHLVASMESLGTFGRAPGGRETMSFGDAKVLLTCLQGLGFSELRLDGFDVSHLMLNGRFRFSNTKIRINMESNLERSKDGAIQDAYFLLRCAERFGSCFCVSPLPFDEKTSPVDVLQLKVGENCYSMLITSHIEGAIPIEEVFRELGARFAGGSLLSALDDLVKVLYQVLKLCQACHKKGFALQAARRKLMLCKMEDGYGRTATSRLRFRGESFALFVSFGLTEDGMRESVDETVQSGDIGTSEGKRQKNNKRRPTPTTGGNSTLCVVSACEIDDIIGTAGSSEKQVDGRTASMVADDLKHLASTFLAILPCKYIATNTSSLVQSLLHLLHLLETASDSLSVERVLEDRLFQVEIFRKSEPHFADLSQNKVSDWTQLPYINYWRFASRILPKVLHLYVQGGPYDAGEGIKLELKPVWIVLNTETWKRKVVIAVSGKCGDPAAVYVCPICRLNGPFCDFFDVRWVFALRSNPMFGHNGRDSELFNLEVACKTRRVGPYIDSSMDAKGANKTSAKADRVVLDMMRTVRGTAKLQNCQVRYVHGYDRAKIESPEKFYAKPWLSTVVFDLTCEVDAYTELAYPYHWFKHQDSYQKTYMARSKPFQPISLGHRFQKDEPKASKRGKNDIGMKRFSS
jgi:hypothetical protein